MPPRVLLLVLGLSAGFPAVPSRGEDRPPPDWAQGWSCTEKAAVTWTDGALVLARGAPHRAVFEKTLRVDPATAPVLELAAKGSTAQWRLTGQAAKGPELVLADSQVDGTCRRNLTGRLALGLAGDVTFRVRTWGWGQGTAHVVRITGLRCLPFGDETEAATLSPDMATWQQRLAPRAARLRVTHEQHPRLRFRVEQRPALRRAALGARRPYAHPAITALDDLARLATEPTFEVNPETYGEHRPAWGHGLVRARPPAPPPLAPGQGAAPFAAITREGVWRTLCWHMFPNWIIGDAIGANAVFRQQARRWLAGLLAWRFWLDPGFVTFDFDCGYPLQCLAMGYDVAEPEMSAAERETCLAAMARMARGLYLNTLTGHGSIYNDLRGNHTAATMCGLGLAGLTLLGKHEDAGLWTALADEFLVRTFDEHTSGAWTESPSYGMYGVNEWLKLAECLRNVCGVDRHQHPFLRRFARYQLMISDWEGRDLAYNGGGAGQYWNQWVLDRIAAETRDPEVQWLAEFLHRAHPTHSGYGDLFWWVDAGLEAARPTATDVGAHYEDIGLNVWRTGWEDRCTILLHHCGIKGQHKEENMNHVTLYARGRRLLPDGIGGKTADHNVPTVDGRAQNRWGPGETLAFFSDGTTGYSLGDSSRATRAPHRRHVLHLRADVVVLVDEFDLGTRRDRALRFHLNPNGNTRVEDGVLRVVNQDVGLVGVVATADGARLPLAVESRRGKARATNQVHADLSGRGRQRVVTLLHVTDAAGATARVDLDETGTGLRFGLLGRVYRLGFGHDQPAPGFHGAGALVLTSIRDGSVLTMAAAGAVDAEGPAITCPDGSKRGETCATYTRDETK